MQIKMAKGEGRLWEYLLVAHPAPEVCEKILEEKKKFAHTYDCILHEQLMPHIALAKFSTDESLEDTLIRWIQRVCTQFNSFQVTLNNFNGVPPDTIYVRILDHVPFKSFVTQLKVISEYIYSNGGPEVQFMNRPHLALANRIPEKVYTIALPDYSRKTFHENFWVTELVLLKRSNQFEQYRQVNVFRFYPPDTNMYGQVAQQLKHQPI